VQPIAATPPSQRAIRAVADLLGRLRLDFAFVGSVARSAHLGALLDAQSIDVLALMTPEQKNAAAMMANNRGFLVDREEIQATEELDMVPFRFPDPDGDIRIHLLVGSNALYGRMVAEGVQAPFEETTLKVPRLEDFALLLQLGNDVPALTQAFASESFDRTAYNRKLAAIGLRELVIPE
jgi:hypothetical protein